MTNVPPQDPGYQAGYQQPQPGYMPPPGGMAPQPAYSGAAAVTADSRQWAMFGHLGGIIFGFLAPLVIMLTKGNEDPFVKEQSTEALNFQITVLIGYLISGVLALVIIGFLTGLVVWVASIVLSIMGGMAANRGEHYRYPFALRLVK